MNCPLAACHQVAMIAMELDLRGCRMADGAVSAPPCRGDFSKPDLEDARNVQTARI